MHTWTHVVTLHLWTYVCMYIHSWVPVNHGCSFNTNISHMKICNRKLFPFTVFTYICTCKHAYMCRLACYLLVCCTHSPHYRQRRITSKSSWKPRQMPSSTPIASTPSTGIRWHKLRVKLVQPLFPLVQIIPTCHVAGDETHRRSRFALLQCMHADLETFKNVP